MVNQSGLSKLTYRRVADRLGIPDRTVVYYFPTKSDLLLAVLAALGERMRRLLDSTATSTPLPADALLAEAWRALGTEQADEPLRVFFQVVGFASAGIEPYPQLAAAVVAEWTEWLEQRIDEADPTRRRAQALASLAQLDGLLLLRRLGGAGAAHEAAGALGLNDP